MSTSQPLPIQTSLPVKTGPSSSSSLDTDSKGDFGGVLNDELDSASSVDVSSAEVKSDLSEDGKLPLDGNSLPSATEGKFQTDIIELLDNNAEAVDVLALQSLDETVTAIPNPVTVAKDFSALEPLKLKHVDVAKTPNVIRFVDNVGVLPSKTVTTSQTSSLLPFANLGLDAETQAITQFKESLQLQKIFSPLTRQAEVSVEVGQISRVLEQFSEFNQKAIVAPTVTTISTTVTPLGESSSTSTSLSAQLSVEVPVKDERWQKAFSQRVVWAVGNNQSAQLRLNPAELGRIDIQVNIENDKASVVFNAQHGAVKEAIEQALPKLREMLAEQGVELEKAEIFNENFNQQQANGQNGSSKHQETDSDTWSGIRDEDEIAATHVSQLPVDDDVVDYYV